jgi:glutaminase
MNNITIDQLRDLGIHPKDPRFPKNNENKQNIKNNFMSKIEKGELEINNWTEIKDILIDTYNKVKDDNNGHVADYIPQLKNVNDELFGAIIVSVDGQVFEIGDMDKTFCVQSCSKPVTYGITLEDYGEEIVHNFVGKEPSGRNFNELCLNEDNLPHNPLINAGAIMTTSLIKPDNDQSSRFEYAYNFWKRLTANTGMSFNNSVYLSEKDTADRNYCLGYMMQEKKAFQEGKNNNVANNFNRKWELGDLNKNLELYFQFCSLETSLLGIGLLAATLANGGVQPWTQDKIYDCKTVQSILSVMYTCGMYDYSGEWGYKIGIPAKSGVSGLIYTVIPGVCGIATYSPKLDKIGNSYRGVQFFKTLVERLNIHIFENFNSNKVSIIGKQNTDKKFLEYLLLYSAKDNDKYTINEVLSKGCDINFEDYDNRTALHVAVCENNLDIIKLLIENNARTDILDRWNKTAIDEADGDKEILELLNYRS